MNRLIILLLLFLLNNCSLNENSQIWKDKEKNLENKKNTEKLFSDKKKVATEFNSELKLDLAKIQTNNIIIDNKNNFGSQSYEGSISKIGNYKFSKLENINQLNFKPVFLNDGIIFFDKKGSIIRYKDTQKVIWKKKFL